ncbi:response regulator [Novosphingobium beihaiensis]|uniref:histidine kinase n=1 Tax=Novosphingobium beihaiensis TaxID=2930389 RepID=A0ABT0BV98_9SPHN|nr:PAS domain-containing hybrid sensor histidine kinase/response regulator [Novosphingobium beihaiensis]MCJ2188858.1 response regulator [Novosphingobium beihaiensis]
MSRSGGPSLPDDPALLKRRLLREQAAREEAEAVLERRSRELVSANEKLSAREAELQKRLEEGNRHLLRAQRTAKIATLHQDLSGQTYISPEFARLLGFDPGTRLTEESIHACVHPLDRQRMMQYRQSFFQDSPSGTDLSYEHRILRRDGTVRWLRWTLQREDDAEGHFRSLFGTVQDITEQRASERRVKALQLIADRRVRQLTRLSRELAASQAEAEQAHRTKSRFLALMSHDIRTPLNGILGMFDLLTQSGLTAEQREQLSAAREAAKQLHQQLDTMIATARAAGGGLPFTPEFVPVRRTLESLVQFWRLGSPETGERLQLHMAADVPDGIWTDPVRLRQLIDAFIERCASQPGAVSIRLLRDAGALVIRVEALETRAIDDDDNLLLQRLSDSIEAELFVWPAAFELHLDAVEETAPESERPDDASREDMRLQIAGRRPRILVVDDVEINRLVLEGMLKTFGCDYGAATDGDEAVPMALSGDFDAVLMDIRMPRMSGIEATREIRARASERLTGLPVIAVTAHIDRDELRELLAYGLTAALSKPVDRRQLFETLRGLMGSADPAPETGHTQPPGLAKQTGLANQTGLAGQAGPVGEAVIDPKTFAAIFLPLPVPRRQMLLAAAISDLEQLGAELEQAVSKGDRERAEHVSHSLKGVAGNMGANGLFEAIVAFRETAPGGMAGLLPQLKEKLAAVIERSRELFEELGLGRA